MAFRSGSKLPASPGRFNLEIKQGPWGKILSIEIPASKQPNITEHQRKSMDLFLDNLHQLLRLDDFLGHKPRQSFTFLSGQLSSWIDSPSFGVFAALRSMFKWEPRKNWNGLLASSSATSSSVTNMENNLDILKLYTKDKKNNIQTSQKSQMQSQMYPIVSFVMILLRA